MEAERGKVTCPQLDSGRAGVLTTYSPKPMVLLKKKAVFGERGDSEV